MRVEWYTLGQMLSAIRLGQKACTPDGRTLGRTARGLVWIGGREDGRPVELRNHLFSDLWTLFEDEESRSWATEDPEAAWNREQDMIANQYEEWLADHRKRRGPDAKGTRQQETGE